MFPWPVKQLRALAALTLVLIGLGSYVRATGAGLSCPDWPLCFGRAVPQFTYGVAQEVIHRYLAAIVMLLCGWILYRGYQLRNESSALFKFGIGILVLVSIQAIFGGLTVTMKLNPFVVTTHLALGTLFFQIVAVSSFQSLRGQTQSTKTLKSSLLVLAVLTFAQILIGGFIGASGAALSCPDFPNCGTELAMTGAQHLQMTHRVLGFSLLGAFLASYFLTLKLTGPGKNKIISGLLRTAFLVAFQVVVGWLNLKYLISTSITVIHIVLAQGILLHVLLLWWRCDGKGEE